jgi:putative ABC transport system permease protein
VWTSVSGVLFWQAGRTGYQIVLAPEGVPTISVSYWAFVAPALLWIGAALLVWRLSDMLLGRGWTVVARALRPVAGKLSRIIAHSLSRQRVPLARAIVLLALALAFAASTATFNATYRAQAEVDAQLTNGADITVTEPPGSSVSAGAAAKLAAVPGVRAVEPIQHRFAYVGADLQVLYGVNPSSITNVTALQDDYFQGGTVEELMHTLAAQPDSLLVSAETVKDFQLRPGDAVNLRIQDARTHHLVTVEFHYIGIVTEFPTAPKDSFFVANAGYIAQRTGTDAIGAFLVDTGGHDTTAVADRIKAAVGTSAAVTDITTARGTVGSSLTAVSLAGLTRIELGFGLVLAAASGGLVLALGLAERRRSFAIADVLGATRRQQRSLVRAEAVILITCGLAAGAVLSWALPRMLVGVLTGVFDPLQRRSRCPGRISPRPPSRSSSPSAPYRPPRFALRGSLHSRCSSNGRARDPTVPESGEYGRTGPIGRQGRWRRGGAPCLIFDFASTLKRDDAMDRPCPLAEVPHTEDDGQRRREDARAVFTASGRSYRGAVTIAGPQREP